MASPRIYISSKWQSRLIGFVVDVFIHELSKFRPVRMSPSEALMFLEKTQSKDIKAVWLNEETGEIVESFASVLRSTNGKAAIAVGTYDRTPIVKSEGFQGSVAEANGEWFIAIGEQCYALGDDGKIDDSKPGFCYFIGRQSQLLNKHGFDSIRRSASELAGKAKENRYKSA